MPANEEGWRRNLVAVLRGVKNTHGVFNVSESQYINILWRMALFVYRK